MDLKNSPLEVTDKECVARANSQSNLWTNFLEGRFQDTHQIACNSPELVFDLDPPVTGRLFDFVIKTWFGIGPSVQYMIFE